LDKSNDIILIKPSFIPKSYVTLVSNLNSPF